MTTKGEAPLYTTDQNNDSPAEASSFQVHLKDPSLNNDGGLDTSSSESLMTDADESNHTLLSNLTKLDYSIGSPTSSEVKVSLPPSLPYAYNPIFPRFDHI